MAVGALAMQVPATVQAEGDWNSVECYKSDSDKHITSKKVAIVDGKLTVTIDIKFEDNDARFVLYVCDKQLVKKKDDNEIEPPYYHIENDVEPSVVKRSEVARSEVKGGSCTYTFSDLTGDKAYYVYCAVIGDHKDDDSESGSYGLHRATYLGTAGSSNSESAPSGSSSSSNTSSSSNSKSAWASYEEKVSNKIEAAPSGSTIVMEKGVSALSNSMMKELLKKGDVSLKLEFTYNDVEYVIIIPAGAALDNDIPWYGPLYLAQQFGNSAGGAAPAAVKAGGAYEVKSGDSMNKIATANNMTLTQLLTKNPQIKDPNKIAVGQKINL